MMNRIDNLGFTLISCMTTGVHDIIIKEITHEFNPKKIKKIVASGMVSDESYPRLPKGLGKEKIFLIPKHVRNLDNLMISIHEDLSGDFKKTHYLIWNKEPNMNRLKFIKTHARDKYILRLRKLNALAYENIVPQMEPQIQL